MNYTAIGYKAALLLTKYGLPVVLKRNGSTIATTVGVFVASKADTDKTVESSIRLATTTSKRALLVSGLSAAPEVGDYITADSTDYYVTVVETIRPSTVTVLYKLELT